MAGIGWFNPDARLLSIIEEVGSELDLKSLRCSYILLLQHPKVKEKLIRKYGQEVYDELYNRYDVKNATEAEEKRKKKIKGLMAFGFNRDEAEALADLSKEELAQIIEAGKAKSYEQQTNLAAKKREKQERKKNLPKIRELKKQLETKQYALERNQKWLDEKDFSMIPEKQVRKNIKTLSEQISEIKKELKELGDSA